MGGIQILNFPFFFFFLSYTAAKLAGFLFRDGEDRMGDIHSLVAHAFAQHNLILNRPHLFDEPTLLLNPSNSTKHFISFPSFAQW